MLFLVLLFLAGLVVAQLDSRLVSDGVKASRCPLTRMLDKLAPRLVSGSVLYIPEPFSGFLVHRPPCVCFLTVSWCLFVQCLLYLLQLFGVQLLSVG